MEGASRVLLNASRSEAAELLQEPAPPRPSSLHDSAAEGTLPFGRDDLYAHSDDGRSPKGSLHGQHNDLGLQPPPARKPGAGMPLWTPPSSRASGGGGGAAAGGYHTAPGHLERDESGGCARLGP